MHCGSTSTFWAKKIIQEKFIKFVKVLKLCQVFVYQNVPILQHYKLLTRTKRISNTF